MSADGRSITRLKVEIGEAVALIQSHYVTGSWTVGKTWPDLSPAEAKIHTAAPYGRQDVL